MKIKKKYFKFETEVHINYAITNIVNIIYVWTNKPGGVGKGLALLKCSKPLTLKPSISCVLVFLRYFYV